MPNLFKVGINDILVVAVEATKQGFTVWEHAVPGLVLGDDFVGMSGTPEGMQEHVMVLLP